MAKQNDEQSTTNYSSDKSVIVMDCTASTTMTSSLINWVDIVERISTVETAKNDDSNAFMQENIFCEEQAHSTGLER
jgi:hypothetical protein